jgi:hypothetical protein
MKLNDVTGIGVKDLGTRVNLVATLPSAVVAIGVLFLVLSGAPSHSLDFDRALRTLKGLGGTELSLLIIALICVVLVTYPLQLSLVRMLEGYGGSRSPLALLRWASLRYHRHRWDRLNGIAEDEDVADSDRRAAAAARLLYDYPNRDALMPTKLGNVLRAAEIRAGSRYGIDAIVAWPRLLPSVSADLRAALDDQRNQLDIACRFCVMLFAGAVITAGLLATEGPWSALTAAPLVLSMIAYQSAVAAARAYGETIKAAFDLHRFSLLEQMHLPMPVNRNAEVAFNNTLYLFLRQGAPVNLCYEHPGYTRDNTLS